MSEKANIRGSRAKLSDFEVLVDDEGVNEGVRTLLAVIRSTPGKRANELVTLIGKSVQSVERYIKSLKDAGKIEFRGAPKNGGYFALGK